MVLRKKGMSVVVASVLLILLTISAVAIIAQFLIPFTEDSLESTECFEFRDHFSFDESFDYNCYDDTNNVYTLSVKVRSDNSSSEKVEGIGFRLTGKGIGTSAIAIEGEGVSTISMMDSRIGNGNVVIPKPTGRYSALSYNYGSDELFERAEVYPVLKGGKVCEKSDSIEIISC